MFAPALLVWNPVSLWLLLGAVLGAAFVRLGRGLRGRRARLWWAGGLVIAAFVYVVFALAQGDLGSASVEWLGVAVFGGAAALGVRGHTGWLAAGWLLHPLWDAGLHPPLAAPAWYVWACLSFDAVVGVALFLQAVRR